jgi:hypothetical protein
VSYSKTPQDRNPSPGPVGKRRRTPHEIAAPAIRAPSGAASSARASGLDSTVRISTERTAPRSEVDTESGSISLIIGRPMPSPSITLANCSGACCGGSSPASAALERLCDEIDGNAGEEYLTATINEILRHRPVLPNAEPRLVKKPIESGGVRYPPGVVLIANAYLLHHDPAVYPDPYSFRPERFLAEPPGTYTWIPFGGGRRRCLGASFALLEMKLVLRAVLERCELQPATTPSETTRRRGITISPAAGGQVVLRDRPIAEAPAEKDDSRVPASV